MSFLRIWLSAGAILALACEDGRVAGGGTDQPNEITAIAVDKQGTRSSDAYIALRRAPFRPDTDMAVAWNAEPVLAETHADTKGRFAFPAIAPGFYYLDILSKDSSQVSIVPFQIAGNPGHHPGELKLIGAAILSGKVRASPVPAFSLHLAGTHYRALVGEHGEFRFPPLLPGKYRLTARSHLDAGPGYLIMDSLILGEGEHRNLDSIRLENDSIPLFDFENSRVRSKLRGILYPAGNDSAGRFKIVDDLVDTVQIGPDAAELALVADGAYQGNSLRISPMAGRRYRMALGTGYYDFSRVGAVALYARTAGDSSRFRIGFSSKAVATGEGSFYATITAGPAWAKIVIRPEDIHPEGNAATQGLTWESVRGAINLITIYPDSTSELWIDEVHLVGASYGGLGEATR